MRAIVFTDKGKVEVQDHFECDPNPGPGEVQIKALYTAVTIGTERNVLLAGPYSSPFPVICGYQNVGRIEKLGEGVDNVAVGDIVYSDVGGQPTNFEGTCWGGHLELKNRPASGNFVKLPDTVPAEDAALFGILGVGMRAVKRGQTKMHDRVLVIGLGLIGQACLQSALAMGADVCGVDLMAERRDLAMKCGATQCWDGGEDGVWDKIRASGEFDVVFETTGVTDMPDNALSTLRMHTGRMVAIGGKFEMKYKNLDFGQGKEATIIHTSHFWPEDTEDVARLSGRGVIKPGALVTHRLDVEDAPKIYQQLIDDPSGMLGIIFRWN